MHFQVVIQKKKISGPLNEELLDCYSPSNDCLNIHSSDIKHHLYQEPRYYFRERIKTCVCKFKFVKEKSYNLYFSEMIYFLLAFIGIASAGLIGPMAAVPPLDAVPLVSFLKRIMVSTNFPGSVVKIVIIFYQDLAYKIFRIGGPCKFDHHSVIGSSNTNTNTDDNSKVLQKFSISLQSLFAIEIMFSIYRFWVI